jgi:hypothetical protein
MGDPPATVTWRRHDDAGWRLEASDLSSLAGAIGTDLFKAFCRCFVHCNRLVSLAQLVLLNAEHVRLDSIPGGRNARTIVWLAAGTLRELSLSLQILRSELRKRQWLDLDVAALETCRALEVRWQEDDQHRQLRDQVAFHVDADVVARGIDALLARGGTAALAEGGGPLDQETSFTIADEAVILGAGDDVEATLASLRDVHADQRVHLAVQTLFVAAVERGGVAVIEA